MEYILTTLIREFYSTEAFLLRYDNSKEKNKIERAIVRLVCSVHDAQDAEESVWRCVERAGCLQLCSDEALLQTTASDSDTALTLKLEALQVNKVEKIKTFNSVVLANELREAADLGDKNACKLLACLCWLGVILPENKQVALKIWLALAVNGDWGAISALVYAYTHNGDVQEANKWRNVLNILQSEYESFSPIALSSQYADCSLEEVQFANLIMFIKQKNARKAANAIDRPMIYYILKSKESFENKMARLSSDTNYYLVMKMEDQDSRRKIGF